MSILCRLPVVLFFFCLSSLGVSGATNLSSWVFPGPSGRMIRQPDALGNRVLDYSGVGYKGGTVSIPDVAVKTNLSPVVGDNGPGIQAALNYVASLPLDTNGFRGAVLLSAGSYAISNSITISASGIVLRGAGASTNGAGTILRAAGPRPTADVATNSVPLIIVSGSGSGSTSGTARNITNNYVPAGACSFSVDNTGGLAVGGRVMITRASPANWIQAIGMSGIVTNGDGTTNAVNPAWTAGKFNVPSERFITRIEGSRVMIDAPLTCAIESQYGGATIQTYSWPGRINNVGIEDVFGVSDFDPSVTSTTGASSSYYADELHAMRFIEATAVENAWVRRVAAQAFAYSCVTLDGGARNMTVRDSSSLDPVSIITGERRYAFGLQDAQNCLVQNCYTRRDRHQFVTDSLDTGPNVFVDGYSDIAYSECGPHFRWGTGAIWDNVTVNGDSANGVLAVRNRGDLGTSHGWAGANEVVWNSRAADAKGGFTAESPPTARNWLIGSIGKLVSNAEAIPYPAPAGTYDSRNTNVFPNSLYYAQLQDRLAAPNLQTREYWLGVIDQFVSSGPTGEVVTVDAAWRSAVQAAAGSAQVNNFDVVTNNQWVPFTCNFSLGTTDRIVGATLVLAMRSYSGTSTNETLYLNSIANSNRFSSLGWLPIGTGTNTTVRVLDLGGQLGLLTNGMLNVAVMDDVGIDWAMLELQVVPVQTLYTNAIRPVADAYVRGGTNAGSNYGTNTTLDVQADASTNNQRQAYLRWNLTGYSTGFQQARVRLTPGSAGRSGLEHGLALVTNSTWIESAINWNNQPGGGKRFATWIPAASVPVEIMVTPQAQAALAADGQLSFELFSLNISNNISSPGLVSYASRVNPNAAFQPQLLLLYSNTVPGVSLIVDQTLPVNSSTGPLPFTVGDPVYAANLLTLGAIASNPTLVPATNIVFSGSLSNRTVTVTPALGQSGSALITVIVTNPAGMTAGSQFSLLVTNGGLPGISVIGNQVIAANTNTGPIPFTISDPAYNVSLLSLGALCANTNLVPAAGLVFGGAISNRTLTVTPASNQTGSVLITVTVTNPAGATAFSPFTLSVTNAGGTTPGSGSWLVDASGDWNNSANWTGGVIATGADMTAAFAIDVTANRYVNNNSPRTLGSLVFSDASSGSPGAWFVTNNPITIQVSNGAPTISVSNVTATINSVLGGNQGLTLQGNGVLVLGGANLYDGATTIASGALRAGNASALGAASSGTTIANDPTARLELAGSITVAEPLAINCKSGSSGNVPAVLNVSGTNMLAGSISLLTGGSYWTFESAAGKLLVTGNTTNPTTTNVRTIWLRGAAEGDWLSAIGDSAGGLVTAIRKDDSGLWTLSGNNTYTGNTVVSNGTLQVNGLVRGGVVSVYGGALGGTGLITVPVTIYSGATLAPGISLGTLTISNSLTLSAGSTTVVELNAQALTNDVVRGLSTVVYAGTLSVTNLAGTLAGGQSFRLFNATSSSGNLSLTPASPGANLVWSFNPTNGTLSVLSLAPPQFKQFGWSGDGNFTMSGTGPTNAVYRVCATTNLAVPLSNWMAVSTGSFAGGVFSFTDLQATNQNCRFYRVVTP